MSSDLFHLAFPVHDLDAAYGFYVEGLGCAPGRRSPHSLILNFSGHQIVAQLTSDSLPEQKGIYPRHFGLILPQQRDWEALVERVKQRGLAFYQEPKVRFPDEAIEHRTFFLKDPSGNLLEFKHYTHEAAIFGATEHSRVGDRA